MCNVPVFTENKERNGVEMSIFLKTLQEVTFGREEGEGVGEIQLNANLLSFAVVSL